jgi:TPP-dependent pyruvate/acetoin dehydrogenase alpha subunit
MPPALGELFERMLVIRLVEEELLRGVQDGRVTGSTHLCIGQEAIPVGACAALESGDPVIATYRGHGWALAKGVPVAELVGEVFGRASELNGGRGGSAYLSAAQFDFYGENSIVGAGVPVALGVAMACQRIHADRLALVAIGDGAMNQGNVHESLNMASVLGVPLLVVVEANGYAEMTPSDALTACDARTRAAAYRIHAVEVDGNDPIAVTEATASARARALSQSQPVLIQANTKRLGGHYSGDAQAYRPAGELDAWREQDPLQRARAALGSTEADRITEQATEAVRQAVAVAEAMSRPDPAGVMAHVYAG